MKIHTANKFDAKKLSDYVSNCGKVLCLLPLDPESKFTLKVLNGVGCFIITANIIGMMSLLLSTAYKNFHDRILVTELLSTFMIYLELFLNILFWRFKRVEFQNLLQGFSNFLTTMKRHERRTINKYLNRYKYFYTFLIICTSCAVIVRVIFAPFRQPQKLPFPFIYPFVIETYSAIYYIIYLSQSIAVFYAGYQTIFHTTVAVVLTHAAIKLELLVYDLKRVRDYGQLKIWIQQHLECIQFVDQINQELGSLIMKSYIILGLAIIFGSIKIIYNPSLFTILRNFATIMSCLLVTYICNAPADDIYEMNQTIGFTLYDMEWNDELIEMRKSIIIIMSRVQKPIFISPLKGLMPALNRKIYTNFLSYLVSYIMTLRAIVSVQQ